MTELLINIGCGKKQLPGYINIDNNPDVKPDICINAKEYIKNLQDKSASAIHMDNFIEHIKDPYDFLKTCLNKLNDCGTIKIITIHALDIIDSWSLEHETRWNAKMLPGWAIKHDYKFEQRLTSRIPLFNWLVNIKLRKDIYLCDLIPLWGIITMPFNIHFTLIKKKGEHKRCA